MLPGCKISHSPPAASTQGSKLYHVACAACHQPDGKGLEGIAPPLADSAWVDAPDEVLIRIVLHGIRGPLVAKGQAYNLEMPAMGFFTDEEVAVVLGYIRERWSVSPKAIQAEQVRHIRTKKRTDSWTLEELGWRP